MERKGRTSIGTFFYSLRVMCYGRVCASRYILMHGLQWAVAVVD